MDAIGDDEEMVRYWVFPHATLSSSGQHVAFSAFYAGRSLTGIANTSTQEVFWEEVMGSVMRWAVPD